MSLEDRLFSNYKVNNNGCWEWQKSLRNGYGAIKYNGKVHLTHRLSFLMHYGYLVEHLFVCHKCDNPKCINPNHLFLGTRSDNMKDCYNKNRSSIELIKGSKNAKYHKPKNRTITDELALKIKKYIKNGFSTKDLVEKFNVSRYLIQDIKRGKSYVNI